MKKFTKIIIYILCFIMLATTLCACVPDSDTGDGDNGNNNNNNNTPSTSLSDIPETEEYLIKDGKSDYVVVVPNNPVGWEALAGNEVVDNVKKATGVSLSVKKESEVTDTQKMIVVGQTELTKQAGVSAPKATYGLRGFVVKEINGNVYIIGGETQATLYGVYEFLHHEFGYEPYATDEIALETGVTEKKILAFNMSEIPDIPIMQGIREYYRFGNAAAGHRMRYNTYTETFINQDQPWHNVFSILPKAQFLADHPKWYANDYELHYTAHGDLDELLLMQDAVYNKLVQMIDDAFAEGKYFEFIGFMQNDHENVFPTSDEPRMGTDGQPLWENEPGHVDSVAAMRDHYGNGYRSAMLIHFINPIQERISNYVADNYDGRKMNIMFFAYFDTERSPAVEINAKYYAPDFLSFTDEQIANGEVNEIYLHETLYKDIYDGNNDGKLQLHPDSIVFMAPIRNEFHFMYEDGTAKGMMEQWAPIAKQQSFWFYDFYFNSCTFMYYDVVYSAQSYFQAAKAVNTSYLFFESGIGGYIPFDRLYLYLYSKLGWDVDADVDAIVDNFFINYFKDAAGSMRKFFDEMTAYYAYLKHYTGFTGVIGAGGQNLDAAYWKEGVLQSWIASINQAYKDIEPLKYTNKPLYDELYSRILYESLSPRFLLLSFCGKAAFTEESYFEEVTQWKKDCATLGVSSAGSNVPNTQTYEFVRS